MEREALIQRLLDYIEENLKADITAEELAEMAGYSRSHFSRIFRERTGLTVSQYLCRRRLMHAAYEISRGMPVTDGALIYGFATKAGFYKAFLREFGMAPTVYAETHLLRPPYPIRLSQEEHIMLTKKQVEKLLLTHWNICGPVADHYRPGTGERADDVWNAGDAFLRMSGNIPAARKAALLAEAVIRAGIPAEEPVRTVKGDILAEEGETGFALYRKSGEPFLSRELTGNAREAELLGQYVGRLDRTLASVRGIDCPVMDLHAHLKDWAVPVVREKGEMELGFWSRYLEELEHLLPKLPRQLIHRDPNASNILKNGGCRNFGMAQENVRLFDPCYAATSVLSETWDDPDAREKWFDVLQTVLRGYDAENPLTGEEKEAVPFMVFSIQLICTAYFGGTEKFRELYHTNLGMLRFLAENRERLRFGI
ncbi:MAG: helix-turn-helix domain-containing protein [Oscillospiraceae bacterium]|nr:helix-turn-helix domain-containing protein [Oscillospiraceae bacterium]